MRNPWVILTLLIGIGALIVFTIQDFVDEALVRPFLYVFWLGRLVYGSIPQEVVWIAFLVIAVIITWRMVVRPKRKPNRGPIGKKERLGRIAGWQKLIHQADQEPYYKWQLAQRLRQLTLGAIARQHRWSRQEVRHHLTQDELGFPPEIQAYFTASRRSLGHFAAKRRLLPTKRRPSPLDLAPEKIAKFLEEKFNL